MRTDCVLDTLIAAGLDNARGKEEETEKMLRGLTGEDFFRIWSEEMQLCAFLSKPSVPVRPGTFQESWERLLTELEKLRQPQKCQSCAYERYCERCPGVLYAESGACDRTSERFCQQAEYNYLLYGKPLDE